MSKLFYFKELKKWLPKPKKAKNDFCQDIMTRNCKVK